MVRASESLTSHGPPHALDGEALAACLAAENLYKSGESQKAIYSLRAFWNGPGTEPRVDGLQSRATAELHLRTSALSCTLDPRPSAQRKARRSLRIASGLFLGLGDMDGVLRCEREVSLSYWREGRYILARKIINRALAGRHDVPADNELAALLILAIIECCAGDYHAALSALRAASPLVEVLKDAHLLGVFYNTYGLVRKNLGLKEGVEEFLQLAFIDYSAAGYYFSLAGNKVKASAVESNRGELLSLCGQYNDARRNIDRAQELARSAGDEVKVAWFEDARARVLMAEKRLPEAKRCAEDAAVSLDALGAPILASEARKTAHEIGLKIAATRHQLSNVVPFSVPLTNLPQRYTLTSSDDSMRYAGIEEGDDVWFYRDGRPEPGELVAVQTPDGLLIRFYYPEGDEVTLLGAHPDCEPETYAANLVRVRGVALRR